MTSSGGASRDVAARRTASAPAWLVAASEVAWRFLVVAGALSLAAVVLGRLRIIVIPFALALLFAGILGPPAKWLESRGLAPLFATWIVVLSALGILGGVISLAAATLAGEIGQFDDVLRQGWQQFMDWVRATPLRSFFPDGDWLSAIGNQVSQNRNRLGRWLLAGVAGAADVAVMSVLTLFFTFFLVKDGEALFAALLGQFHTKNRLRGREAGMRIWGVFSRYFRGMALIALFNSLLTAIALFVIGVPLIVALVLITFLGSFIPFVGAVVASTVAALVALSAGGALDAALVILAGIVIQQIEGNVLEPIVMSRVMKLHPLVIASAVTAGAVLAGLPGAFFAVPIAGAASALYTYFASEAPSAVATPVEHGVQT